MSPTGLIKFSGFVQGLPTNVSNTKFGFHIHEDPFTGYDCKTAGPHFNPTNSTHGSQIRDKGKKISPAAAYE